MEKDKCNLDLFKEDYKDVQKQFDLPNFEELNQDFQIEKIADIETDYLLREIRKMMADKIGNYLRFIETLLNPSNVPMFVYTMIKNFENNDKELLSELYKKLAKIETNLVRLDLQYNEQAEAEFIKSNFTLWQEAKTSLIQLMDKVDEKWDNKTVNNGKNYFG